MQNGKKHPLPLHHAIRHSDPETLKQLIQQGHALEEKDPRPPCWPPLHYACSLGKIDLVTILLKAKANFNTRDMNDHTALCIATQHNHISIMSMLINSGASPKECYMQHKYLIHIAAENHDTRALSLLIHYESSIIHTRERHLGDPPLYTAIKSGNLDAIRILIQHGVSVTKSLYYMNPLHVASHANQPEAIILLLHYGAKINALTEEGNSALDIALMHHHAEAAVTLISRGALSMQVKRYETQAYPIHAAVRCHMDQHIGSMLMRGYDINSRDSHGATPLDIAIEDPTSMAYPILASQGGYAAITKKSASTLLVEAIAADNMPRASYIYHHFSPKGKNNPMCINRTAEYIRYCKNHSPLASTLLIYRKIKPKQFSQHLDTLRLIAFNHLKQYILPIGILNKILYLANMIPEHTNILYLLPITWTTPPPQSSGYFLRSSVQTPIATQPMSSNPPSSPRGNGYYR